MPSLKDHPYLRSRDHKEEHGAPGFPEQGLSAKADLGLRLAAIAALAALMTVTVASDDFLTTDKAGLIIGAILLALVLAVVPLRRLSNLRSLKGFGFEIELAEKAAERADATAFAVEGRKAENTETTKLTEGTRLEEIDEIVDLQLLFEAKLAYVAKDLLARDASGHWSSFVTIGSLKYDKLLSREEAIAARRLLGLKASDIEQASDAQRARYLQEVKPLVSNVRATIFYNLVKKQVKRLFGKAPDPVGRGGKQRADLAIWVDIGGRRLQVLFFPAFAAPRAIWHDSEKLETRAVELSERSDLGLIVVPPACDVKLGQEVEQVKLLPVRDLIAAADAAAEGDLTPGDFLARFSQDV